MSNYHSTNNDKLPSDLASGAMLYRNRKCNDEELRVFDMYNVYVLSVDTHSEYNIIVYTFLTAKINSVK